jgi:hypothetical protein
MKSEGETPLRQAQGRLSGQPAGPFDCAQGRQPATWGGKWGANFLLFGTCETPAVCLASKPESRPAALVMVVTDF